MELLLVVALIVALNIGALAFGKDTRDADDWMIHRSV
jgi:hypothetical protein